MAASDPPGKEDPSPHGPSSVTESPAGRDTFSPPHSCHRTPQGIRHSVRASEVTEPGDRSLVLTTCRGLSPAGGLSTCAGSGPTTGECLELTPIPAPGRPRAARLLADQIRHVSTVERRPGRNPSGLVALPSRVVGCYPNLAVELPVAFPNLSKRRTLPTRVRARVPVAHAGPGCPQGTNRGVACPPRSEIAHPGLPSREVASRARVRTVTLQVSPPGLHPSGNAFSDATAGYAIRRPRR